MKKMNFALAINFSLLLLLSGEISAQSSRNSLEGHSSENFMPTLRKLARLTNPVKAMENILDRNEVPVAAVRDFVRNFDSVHDALWFVMPSGGIEAYFENDGFGNRVIYGKDGGWLSSQIAYKEDKLPRYILEAVKFSYPDMLIRLVEERHTIETLDFVIYLEDPFHILILKLNAQNQLDVLQDLVKG